MWEPDRRLNVMKLLMVGNGGEARLSGLSRTSDQMPSRQQLNCDPASGAARDLTRQGSFKARSLAEPVNFPRL